MTRILFYVFFTLYFQFGTAQNSTIKIVDSKTGESIPYANIRINDAENLISNTDGFFSLSDGNDKDSSVLDISYLGYVNRRLTVAQIKNQQNIIKLEPGIVELAAVDTSKPDPYSIMATVKKNLKQNYKNEGIPTKEILFYREANTFKPQKLTIEITTSTGFTKSGLKTANAELKAFTSKIISNPPKEFTDMLCHYYTRTKMEKNKQLLFPKLEMIKATKLKDENQSANVEDMEQLATKMLLQHLDSTKYYRVKSGLFGSRDSISLRKDFNKEKQKKSKKNQLTESKAHLVSFMSKNNFLQNNKLDFVSKPELYEYTYDGALYSNENEFVYVLKFKPKKSKADYTGKLYISETDYAVVRADYKLAEGKTAGGFNMKLLLGIKVSENNSKGTLIYNRNLIGNGYYLRYASVENGVDFYVNRPVKFIELTRSEKDVLALDFTVDGSSIQKREVLNISRSEITAAAFDDVKENNFKFINLKKYDPMLWKDISTIEPLDEMKQFKAAN